MTRDPAAAPSVRFSGPDSSWWHMEEPTNHMAITAVLIFDGPLDEDRLRRVLSARLLSYDRFRQRVVDPRGPGRPRWEEDGALAIDRHLDRIRLECGAGQEQLEAAVGREMGRPLPADRPLWRMIHVEGYGGSSALMVRVHHCIADGLALVRVLLTLDDEQGNEDATYARYFRPAADSAGNGLAAGARAVGSLGRLVGMRPDPRSALRGSLGLDKRAAWSAPLMIPDLRHAAREAGATLNDVVLSAVAGGLGRYLTDQGDRLARQIRAVVPVNLRTGEDRDTLGNRFGLVFAALPVGIPDPLERLAAVRVVMDRLKRSPQAAVVYGLLDFFGRTPRRALDLAVGLLGSKGSLVLTNVPGPRQRIRFCGRELTTLMAWVPQSGRLGVGVSILTYGDELRLGVASDALVIPRPRALVDAFQAAARQLFDAVRPSIAPGIRQ